MEKKQPSTWINAARFPLWNDTKTDFTMMKITYLLDAQRTYDCHIAIAIK